MRVCCNPHSPHGHYRACAAGDQGAGSSALVAEAANLIVTLANLCKVALGFRVIKILDSQATAGFTLLGVPRELPETLQGRP